MSISESLAPQKIPNKLKPPLRIVLQAYQRVYGKAILLYPVNRFKATRFKNMIR